MINTTMKDCSLQVRKLAESSTPYRLELERLLALLEEKPTGLRLKSAGYGYLVTLWYQASRRDCGRKGFSDLLDFARYVGPRPSPRHQLHRINNSRGYERDNIQWEPQKRFGVQSLVKSNTRPHKWMGKRLSHAELANELVKRGKKVTEGSIAKMTQRMRKQMPATMVTEAIVTKYGLRFERSTCPIENWDFPPELKRAAYAYQQYHSGRTRIEFTIQWLDGERWAWHNEAQKPLLSDTSRRICLLRSEAALAANAALTEKYRQLEQLKYRMDRVDYRLSRPTAGLRTTTAIQGDLFSPEQAPVVPRPPPVEDKELDTQEELMAWLSWYRSLPEPRPAAGSPGERRLYREHLASIGSGGAESG